ncbi:hypothetical protein CDL15_Pgr025203 [Punica granatum]|nr:hypothetical protein CDL15_Pgr025203 [Punica granatum]
MEKEHLPRGYRFYPNEEELLSFYLHNQLEGRNAEHIHRVIPVIDIYEKEPQDLPQLAGELCRGDTEQWFFFVPRQEREARGGRLSRSTASGYWKGTGSPGYVYSSDHRVIGLRRSMVFYLGHAHTGRKTEWKMHEYKAIQRTSHQDIPKLRHEFTLCRVYVISGSFRAFERRPEVAIPEEARPVDASASGGEYGASMDKPESSSRADPTSGSKEPMWDLEQLNLDKLIDLWDFDSP